jgi:hypothetical protein
LLTALAAVPASASEPTPADAGTAPEAARPPPGSSWIRAPKPKEATATPPAGAATPPAATATPPAAPLTTTLQTPPPPAPGGDDFDLLAPAPVLDSAQLASAQELEAKLKLRRKLLGLHQVAGFVNLAALGTAVVLGQLSYTDKYGGGGDTQKYITAHGVAAYTSAGIFAATGLLALFAPSPIDQPARLSTATVHKTLMAVATAGMAAQILLGIVLPQKEGSISQRDFALAHQIIGYSTLAATTGGFIAIAW